MKLLENIINTWTVLRGWVNVIGMMPMNIFQFHDVKYDYMKSDIQSFTTHHIIRCRQIFKKKPQTYVTKSHNFNRA